MLATLEMLDHRQDLATQAAVFESAVWRVDVRHYWVYFRMARVYGDLGRPNAAFLMTAMAAQMHPEWPASFQPLQDLFRQFVATGRTRDALDVFLRQVKLFPEKPIAEPHEIEALAGATGLASLLPRRELPRGRDSVRVVEAERRLPTPIAMAAGEVPFFLRPLETRLERTAIDVVRIAHGELLICRDSVAVRDQAGEVQRDLSVALYPDLVADKVLAGAEPVEEHEAAAAVLILDAFPPPNLAHFLLDQATRLGLYRRAGLDDFEDVLVVGPEPRASFQHDILDRAGVKRVLGTDRVARVRAGMLWVSTNCRQLQHIAHLGADWAIAEAQALLGGRGTHGTRRLYISREDAQSRHVRNEAELRDRLAGHGFETIVPGRLPYDDQLAAFREASHVVGAHGAAFAHLALCPPQTRVLELFHPLYGTSAFALVALGAGLSYAALTGRDGLSDDAALNEVRPGESPGGRFGERDLRIDVDAVLHWLEANP